VKVRIKPQETIVVTSPIQIPEPSQPRHLTHEENVAVAKFVEQMNAGSGKRRIPTAEESAAITRFVEQLKASAKKGS
jgi:hypothetical protein